MLMLVRDLNLLSSTIVHTQEFKKHTLTDKFKKKLLKWPQFIKRNLESKREIEF